MTSVARTLWDLAASVETRDLERAVAEAFALKLVSAGAIGALLDRYNGRPGARRLKNVLGQDNRPAFTRSKLEERFLALVRKARAEPPEVNARIAGHEVDFLWRTQRLIVEVDGRAFHSSKRAFETDRCRDAALACAGYRVIRFTWHQITAEPEAVLLRLGQALAVT